uniref:Unspecific monooxygenase n=1 Tax=Opuntia streptacantha TaxID=393608 RepID=A0A7C9A3R1_OPUST
MVGLSVHVLFDCESMAPVLLFVLTIASILLILTLISQIFKTQNSNLPPGKTGWPVLGETLAFTSSPEKFVHDRMNMHSSDIFKTCIAGERMAVLCGPSANKFIFSNETKLFNPWWPRSVSQALLFAKNAGKISSFLEEDHSFLKLDSMQNYVPIMDSMAKDHVDTKWSNFDEVKVHPLAKEFTFALACRIFINCGNPNRVRDLMVPFFAVAEGIMSAPVNFPGTPFRGAVKGGKIIKQRLLEIINERKMEIAEKGIVNLGFQDLLSRLLVSSLEDGKFFSPEEFANKIIGYLIASFYTTSTAITFVLNHLAEYPHVYDKVLEEQVEIAKSKEAGEMLKWADVQKMKYTWNAVCESMRLEPPAQGAFKEVLTDFNFAGFNIPKGWKVHSQTTSNGY